ncbi:iron-containing alcohol dehydrogenase [Pseudomaricurvus alkylphenolicus]|uniref:iron-containing alcohol dehydrogenase n=1 Tax=Pseudomaricurvus alkylphenolicus TaxID=1306991 RepID=UPI0014221F0B|nr:iron-containing alcohol dehydrogenase [Pseudomaricurvus alkylphenolicus]NIB40071.1 iron-containing alcohol dehydrogenase [Pseudomaricurvus alkylphenolicus]
MSKTGYFQYNMRTAVHCAVGGIVRLPSLFEGLGAKRVLLLSDAGLKQVGIVDKVVQVFENMNSGTTPKLVGVYPEITPDAGCDAVNAALRYAREIAADSILAVGGGSVLDAAKGVKYALHHNLTDFREVVDGGIRLESWPSAQPISIPHIAVPTTAGTGAEVSAGAVFLNEETGIKCNLAAPFIEADMALLDAQLTVGLPAGLTASTGMDALTHALEAVASPSANHFSDAHALLAAQLIEQNLPKVVQNGKDIDARNNMIQASTMAINAFMMSLNAIPVHNCAHAFGGLYHVPHGDANAVLLPIVMEALPEFYAANASRLAQALNLDSNASGESLLADVVEHLRQFQQRIGCATDFKRWHVSVEDLERQIVAIASDPAALFYPIPVDRIQRIATKAVG